MHYFDCHADTLTEIPQSESLMKNSCCLDLERVRTFAGHYTQIFAVWKDRADMPKEPEKSFLAVYKRACQLLGDQAAYIEWCRNASDMQKAHAAGKAAAFLSVEDISAMGNLAGQAGELGFRFAMLTWNYENEYACGAVAGQSEGLTQRGRVLARQLLQQNLVLDISHLSDQGAEDIFHLTDRPVMASHSNVRDVCSHPRNLKKAHIQELIRRNGLMGINFYDEFTGGRREISDLIRHIDAVLESGGEDILALGGDFDGCGDQFPRGIIGVQSVPDLKGILEREQFGKEVLDKIFWKNGERFILENVV